MVGTFLWTGSGYQFDAAPPRPLLDRSLLLGSDPWTSVASALEFSKHGDHEAPGALARWFRPGPELGFLQSCLDLIGDAGLAKHMNILSDVMKSGHDEYLRIQACAAAAQAGYLWLGWEMLETWKAVRTKEKASISLFLSQLLDFPGRFEVFDHLEFDEYAGYIAFVEDRLRDLETRYGSKDAVVFQGFPFDVGRVAERMRDLLRPGAPGSDLGDFDFLRHRFEAATGIDCRSFYRNDEFQPLSAAAILEGFLAGDRARSYAPGVRYFFGHPIPPQ